MRDHHGRSSRAFNPATVPDLTLFAAVLRGERTLQGFRNREVRTRLFGPTATADRRRSAQVSRLVKRLTCAVWSRRFPARAAGASPSSATPS